MYNIYIYIYCIYAPGRPQITLVQIGRLVSWPGPSNITPICCRCKLAVGRRKVLWWNTTEYHKKPSTPSKQASRQMHGSDIDRLNNNPKQPLKLFLPFWTPLPGQKKHLFVSLTLCLRQLLVVFLTARGLDTNGGFAIFYGSTCSNGNAPPGCPQPRRWLVWHGTNS